MLNDSEERYLEVCPHVWRDGGRVPHKRKEDLDMDVANGIIKVGVKRRIIKFEIVIIDEFKRFT